MAPSSDGLLSSILNDDDLQLMDPAMGADGKDTQAQKNNSVCNFWGVPPRSIYRWYVPCADDGHRQQLSAVQQHDEHRDHSTKR